MKRFYLCKVCLIVLGVSSGISSAVASERKSFICTAKQIYFLNSGDEGQLYIPPNNYVAGQRFVVDRFTGQAQGDLLDTTRGGWEVQINSTGNVSGDWNPSFTYLGKSSALDEGDASWPQIVRHTYNLTLKLPYTGPIDFYRKEDQGSNIVFVLSNSLSVTSGVCESL